MLIPVDVGAAIEQKPVPNGTYDLQITDCVDGKSQKGKPQLAMSIAIEGHEDAPNVRHWVSFPADGDDADTVKFKTLLLKRFLTLFKQPIPNAIDTEKLAMSLVGAKARAEVILDKPDDAGNVYNRLTVPRIREESQVAGAVAKPPKR